MQNKKMSSSLYGMDFMGRRLFRDELCAKNAGSPEMLTTREHREFEALE